MDETGENPRKKKILDASEMPSFAEVYKQGIPALPESWEIEELDGSEPRSLVVDASEIANLIVAGKELSSFFRRTMLSQVVSVVGEDEDGDGDEEAPKAPEQVSPRLLVACLQAVATLDILSLIMTARLRSSDLKKGTPESEIFSADDPEKREEMIARLLDSGATREQAEASIDHVRRLIKGEDDGSEKEARGNPGSASGSSEVLEQPDPPEEEGEAPLRIQW